MTQQEHMEFTRKKVIDAYRTYELTLTAYYIATGWETDVTKMLERIDKFESDITNHFWVTKGITLTKLTFEELKLAFNTEPVTRELNDEWLNSKGWTGPELLKEFETRYYDWIEK